MSNLALRRSIKQKTYRRTSQLPNQKTVILKNCFGNKKTTKNLSSPSLLHITTYTRTTYIRTTYIRTTYIRTTYIRTTYIRTTYIRTTYIRTTYIRTTYIRTTYPMTRSQDFLSVQKNNIDNKL